MTLKLKSSRVLGTELRARAGARRCSRHFRPCAGVFTPCTAAARGSGASRGSARAHGHPEPVQARCAAAAAGRVAIFWLRAGPCSCIPLSSICSQFSPLPYTKSGVLLCTLCRKREGGPGVPLGLRGGVAGRERVLLQPESAMLQGATNNCYSRAYLLGSSVVCCRCDGPERPQLSVPLGKCAAWNVTTHCDASGCIPYGCFC